MQNVASLFSRNEQNEKFLEMAKHFAKERNISQHTCYTTVKSHEDSSMALFPLRLSVHSTTLCLLYGPLPLYGPLSLYCRLSNLGPSVPSATPTAVCLLHGPLSPLRPSVPSKAIGPNRHSPLSHSGPIPHYGLYPPPPNGPLSPLRPSVTSTALCHIYGSLSPLRPLSPSWPLSLLRQSVPSAVLYPLHCPLSLLWPSVPLTSLCPHYGPLSLYGPLPPLRPSTSSTVLCLLYSPLSSTRNVFSYCFEE